MEGALPRYRYERGPYPLTWARDYGDGRVFYTGLEAWQKDWENKDFQALAERGINGHQGVRWISRRIWQGRTSSCRVAQTSAAEKTRAKIARDS